MTALALLIIIAVVSGLTLLVGSFLDVRSRL